MSSPVSEEVVDTRRPRACLLAVEGLSVSYRTDQRTRPALEQVDLSVETGEIFGLVGQSGSGKSTLALAILGLLPSNARQVAGSVALDGADLTRMSAPELRQIRGQEISVVFQDPASSLNPRLPVGKQMIQVQRAHGPGGRASRRAYHERAVAGLAEVGLPDPGGAFGRYPHEFSGGMRQRVMIAMSLLLEPKLIIADEATSALDVTLEAQILELLLRLRESHDASVLFISHNLGVVSQLCDRTAVLHAGRVVEEINQPVVWDNCLHPYTQSLAASVPDQERRAILSPAPIRRGAAGGHACSFAEQCVQAHSECVVQMPSLYRAGGSQVRCFAYSPELGSRWSPKPALDDWLTLIGPSSRVDGGATGSSASLISVEDLRVHFGAGEHAVRAVDGVSMTIDHGEIVAVVGESGSGKTTLAEAIVRLVRPAAGSIKVDGQELNGLSPREIRQFRRRVQMVFQNAHASLSPRMQVGTLVTEPYDIFSIATQDRLAPDALLEQVQLLPHLLDSYPGQLSGGQARRVSLARALACEPDLLVADEPTSGLDASAAASVTRLLSDLRESRGLAILLITHDLSLVTSLADRVCVMYFGRVVETGRVEDVLRRPAHPYTKALLSLLPDRKGATRIGRRKLLAHGEIPNQADPPAGCRFHPRCALRRDICRTIEPTLDIVQNGHHRAACHFSDELLRGQLDVE